MAQPRGSQHVPTRKEAEFQIFLPTERRGRAERLRRGGMGIARGAGTFQGADRPSPAGWRWGELGRQQQTGKLERARGRGPASHLSLPRVRPAPIGRSAARHRKWLLSVASDTRQQLRCSGRGPAEGAWAASASGEASLVPSCPGEESTGLLAPSPSPECRPAPDSGLLC
ncbi:hypothetical protein HispidOSU_006022 [Sigmodon hispidus]